MKWTVIQLLVLIQAASLHAQSASTKEGTPTVASPSPSSKASLDSVVSTIASVVANDVSSTSSSSIHSPSTPNPSELKQSTVDTTSISSSRSTIERASTTSAPATTSQESKTISSSSLSTSQSRGESEESSTSMPAATGSSTTILPHPHTVASISTTSSFALSSSTSASSVIMKNSSTSESPTASDSTLSTSRTPSTTTASSAATPRDPPSSQSFSPPSMESSSLFPSFSSSMPVQSSTAPIGPTSFSSFPTTLPTPAPSSVYSTPPKPIQPPTSISLTTPNSPSTAATPSNDGGNPWTWPWGGGFSSTTPASTSSPTSTSADAWNWPWVDETTTAIATVQPSIPLPQASIFSPTDSPLVETKSSSIITSDSLLSIPSSSSFDESGTTISVSSSTMAPTESFTPIPFDSSATTDSIATLKSGESNIPEIISSAAAAGNSQISDSIVTSQSTANGATETSIASSTMTSIIGSDSQSTDRSPLAKPTGVPITISFGGTAIMTIISSIAQNDGGNDFEADGASISSSPIEVTSTKSSIQTSTKIGVVPIVSTDEAGAIFTQFSTFTSTFITTSYSTILSTSYATPVASADEGADSSRPQAASVVDPGAYTLGSYGSSRNGNGANLTGSGDQTGNTSSSHDHKSLIVGATIGGCVFLIALISLILVLRRRRQQRKPTYAGVDDQPVMSERSTLYRKSTGRISRSGDIEGLFVGEHGGLDHSGARNRRDLDDQTDEPFNPDRIGTALGGPHDREGERDERSGTVSTNPFEGRTLSRAERQYSRLSLDGSTLENSTSPGTNNWRNHLSYRPTTTTPRLPPLQSAFRNSGLASGDMDGSGAGRVDSVVEEGDRLFLPRDTPIFPRGGERPLFSAGRD